MKKINIILNYDWNREDNDEEFKNLDKEYILEVIGSESPNEIFSSLKEFDESESIKVQLLEDDKVIEEKELVWKKKNQY